MKEEKQEKNKEIILEEYSTDENWIRAGRRRFLILNVIYYLQHNAGKKNGVSKNDLLEFLEVLQSLDREIFFSIIKPGKPIELTLEKLLADELITENPEGRFFVNEERITSERGLIYWECVERVFDKVKEKMSFID